MKVGDQVVIANGRQEYRAALGAGTVVKVTPGKARVVVEWSMNGLAGQKWFGRSRRNHVETSLRVVNAEPWGLQ